MSDSHQVADLKTTLRQWCELVGPPDSDLEKTAEFKNWEQAVAWADDLEIPPEQQIEAFAKVLELDYINDVSTLNVCPEFVRKVPIQFARQHQIAGIETVAENPIDVLIGSIGGTKHLDNVARILNRRVNPIGADGQLIEQLINQAYQTRVSQTAASIQSLDREQGPLEITRHEDLLEDSGKSSIVKVVNSILFDAVQLRASDIHIQPYESHLQVRFRIDGVLFDQFEIPKVSQEEVISRIKVISQMDIAEKRLPQDGRSTIRVGDRTIDLRVASLPTSYGERVVIRLLDKSTKMYSLSDLGMMPETHQQFRKLIQQEHGLILVTGPTGSGKSTTLYASLQELDTISRNVVTLEDPIEYQLASISQTQINEKKGMTFARGLRNVLRQDPDIIMVGEIRDQETAEMAIQSALTGHMVFSTLHTNDAASAITRLLDLGVEEYLVSSSVVAVMAQRLVRKICIHCSVPDDDRSALDQLGVSNEKIPQAFRGTGCEKCRDTGFLGRVGLFELLVIDSDLQQAIQRQEDASLLRNIAINNGMQLLKLDGIDKISAGQTTIGEVVRVTMN